MHLLKQSSDTVITQQGLVHVAKQLLLNNKECFSFFRPQNDFIKNLAE